MRIYGVVAIGPTMETWVCDDMDAARENARIFRDGLGNKDKWKVYAAYHDVCKDDAKTLTDDFCYEDYDVDLDNLDDFQKEILLMMFDEGELII